MHGLRFRRRITALITVLLCVTLSMPLVAGEDLMPGRDIAEADSYLPPTRAGARYFEFTMRNMPSWENFVAATADPSVITQVLQQLALPEDQRTKHINGPIDSGNGGHNLGWIWHFVPDQWALADFSIELCDGMPSMVEADLYYWLHVIGSFCPWSSYVLREIVATCGDANGDQSINIGDAVYIINYTFKGGPMPIPLCVGEFDGEGAVNIGDAVYLINYIFKGGPLPVDPCCP